MTLIISSILAAGIVLGVALAQVMPHAGETLRDKVCPPALGLRG